MAAGPTFNGLTDGTTYNFVVRYQAVEGKYDASPNSEVLNTAIPHSITHHEAKAPTCTEAGWDAYDRCSACDYTTKVEKAALNHDFTGNFDESDANGHWHICNREGCNVTDTKSEHQFVNYTYNNDADYTKNGTETAICEALGCEQEHTREKAGSQLVDNTAPTAEITVKENSWKSFINTITFGVFAKDKFDVTITAEDKETGVKSVEYYLSETPISETDIVNVATWTTYSAFSLENEGKYIVYAKITDNSNNITYISTDGMVVDRTVPVITGITDGKTYCVEQTFTVNEENVKSVTVNGMEAAVVDGVYTIEAANAEYTVVVTDKADNTATVTVTVNNGHTFTNYVSNNDATCTTDGTKKAECDYCDATDTVTDIGSKKGHSFTKYVYNNDATYEADGTETAKCENKDCTETDTRTAEGTKLEKPANPDAPFIKGEDGKEGWDVIKDRTEGAKDGDKIVVDMNGTTTVPGDVIDSIKGKDVDITFDMGNGITWTVNGKTVTSDKVNDIDFAVETGTKTIPVDVINKVTGERYSINISLAYDGEFGFTAVMSINMDKKNAGLYANLFYYNESKNALEFICADEIDANGNAELTFTHASDYTIVIDKEPMNGKSDIPDTDDDKADTTTPAPKTGDTTSVLPYAMSIIACAAICTIVLRKRNGQR